MRRAVPTLARRPPARGASLIELLVGLVAALLVVAMSLAFVATVLRVHRQLQAEMRLAHDLRAAADRIEREWRRAGYRGDSERSVWVAEVDAGGGGAGVGGVGTAPVATDPPDAPAAWSPTNPYAEASVDPLAATASWSYSHDLQEDDMVSGREHLGLRLHAGVIEFAVGQANWQALTDPATMQVTALTLTSTTTELPLAGACDRPCPTAQPACGPHLSVRHVAFMIAARTRPPEPPTTRTLQGAFRLRNDVPHGSCPA